MKLLNKLNSILKKYLKEPFTFIPILILTFWAFQNVFLHLLSGILINPIFDKIEPKFSVDLFIWSISLLVIVYLSYNRKRVAPIFKYILFSCSITFSFTWEAGVFDKYRAIEASCDFLFFNHLEFIWIYAVPLFCIGTSEYFWSFSDWLLKFFLTFFGNEKLKTNEPLTILTLQPEKAISSIGDDVFKYAPHAKRLVKHLFELKSEYSYCVGINAPWGMGKTSYINLMMEVIKDTSNDIIIEFSPWSTQKTNNVSRHFYETILNTVRINQVNLFEPFDKYFKAFIDSTSTFTSIRNSIETLFEKEKTISTLYDDINDTLDRINRKIYIIIDDIDRLKSDEIMEVLQIVRNTGYFKNFVYILAYDDKYVSHALKSISIHNADQFLEKIVNVEISLPKFHKSLIFKELSSILCKQIDLNKGVEHSILDVNIPFIADYLNNLRDIKRLSNSLLLDLGIIKDDIDHEEFIILQTLKLKFISCYRFIKNGFENRLLNNVSHVFGNNIISLPQEKELTQIIKENFTSPQEQEKVFDIVVYFFGMKSYKNNQIFRTHTSRESIRYIDCYDRYFSFGLWGQISRQQFIGLFHKDWKDDIVKQLNKWLYEGRGLEVKKLFENTVIKFNSSLQFENYLRAIFFYANTGSINHNFNHLHNKIIEFSKLVGEESAKKYIYSLLINSLEISKNDFFSSFLIQYIKYIKGESSIYKSQELESIAIKHLKCMYRKNSKPTDEFDLFLMQLSTPYKNTNTIEFPVEINIYIKNLMIRDYRSFINRMVIRRKEGSYQDEYELDLSYRKIIYSFYLEENKNENLSTITQFYNELKNTIGPSEFIDEFYDFANKFSEYGFSMRFDFLFVEPERTIRIN